MAPRPSPDTTFRTPWLAVVLALGAFVVVSTGVRSLVPWPRSSGLREKLEHFASVRDEIDVVYVGSSTFFRSFRPRVIDEALAARGHPLRSYNLGVGGMGSFEADHVLATVLALRPARLRWVVIEPRLFDGALATDSNARSERSVTWHTPARTLTAVRSLWRGSASLAERLTDTLIHVQLAGRRLASLGRAPDIVEQLLGRDAETPILSRRELDRERGFQALDDLTGVEFLARRKAFLDDPDGYAMRVAALESRARRRAPLEEVFSAPFAAQRQAVEAAGAELLAAIPPRLVPAPHAATLHAEGIVPHLLAFNVPSREPALFAARHRHDSNHLNRAGADLFSRRFAEQFATLLDER